MILQTYLFAILGVAAIWWLWGKVRPDLVALIALFALVYFNVIPAHEAFAGFSHPAVITLAAMMVMSKALQVSGVLDYLARVLNYLGPDPLGQILVLCALTAFAAAFMSNLGAMVIMIPIAIHISGKHGIPVSKVLMPLSFASILGGMSTLVGTAPNLIISSFKESSGSTAFSLFSFIPVGGAVALTGVIFLGLIGWRLLPERHKRRSADDDLSIEDYITEVKVLRESRLAGSTLRKIMQNAAYEVTVIGLAREKLLLEVIDPDEELLPDDILIIEADSENLKTFMDFTQAKLIGGRKFHKDAEGARNISMREVVILQDSRLVGKSAADINLRSRYGINLLAISRGGRKTIRRVSKSRFRVGDVLLIQGRTQILGEVVSAMGCMPLHERGMQQADPYRAVLSLGIFGVAIAMMLLGLLPAHMSLAMAALLLALTNVIAPREIYHHIDWSTIVLLATLIPVANALLNGGGAQSIAGLILHLATGTPVWVSVGLIIALCMLLANLISNVATAVLMAPVAILTAQLSGASSEMFLMAVAIGASSTFVTPFRHQSNTIVMGPGSYRFGDFVKLGLPMQVLVLLSATPLLYWYWH